MGTRHFPFRIEIYLKEGDYGNLQKRAMETGETISHIAGRLLTLMLDLESWFIDRLLVGRKK